MTRQQILTKAVVLAGFLAVASLAAPQYVAAQTATKLKCNGCIKSKQIKNGKVKAKDMHSSAKPGGANFSSVSGADFSPLPGADTVVASVTMELPAGGVVILNAGGWATFIDNPSSVVCSISKTTSSTGQPIIISQNHNVGNARRMPTPVTRGFIEDTGGTYTYYYVCRSDIGSSLLSDAILTAIYVPQLYGPAPAADAAEGSASGSGKSPRD